MTPGWINQAVFYHIYPLGLCDAPRQNDFQSSPVPRLEKLVSWLDHIQGLGANALYLGPLFESSVHGYDTANYFLVDRRLGSVETLSAFSQEVHRRGMRLVLDGVFNHVGRDFWAFRDLQVNGSHSPYVGWFHPLDFNRSSPYGDPFHYEGWSGHYDLVKLNLHHAGVRQHLFEALRFWIDHFAIDGLRLDAADQVDPSFLSDLAQYARSLRSDFWLMGEMVFGDYRKLVNADMLDSVTNYEVYKSLYSSHATLNYYEIAYALNRQFGPDGIYRGQMLYTFADNHDVNRVASSLKSVDQLYPLYSMLFTLPGVPSIYYGSEWGLADQRTQHSDEALRPSLDINQADAMPEKPLSQAISRLAQVRQASPALRCGDYTQLYVAHQQMAFLRRFDGEQVVVAVNNSAESTDLDLRLPIQTGRLVDLLNPGDTFEISNYQVHIDPLPPRWARVLRVE